VSKVAQGAARKAGFQVGDVVLMLDGVSVTDPVQFQRLEQQLPYDRPVPVLVQRPGATLFLPLHAGH
jgi:serine protease Do